MDRPDTELFKLPFVRIAPFMAAGMLLAYFGGSAVCAIGFVCAAAFAVFAAVKRKAFGLCAVGLAAGLLITTAYLKFYCEPVLRYSGETIRGEFIVSEITSVSGDTQRVTAKLNLGGIPAKVSLSCENSISEGERASAVIELGEYDEENRLYNLANGILLSGSAAELEIIPSDVTTGTGFLKTLRRELMGSVQQTLFGEEREMAMAMLFGEGGKLPQKMREQLRICGAAHFTAVSGTHFAVFGAVVLSLISEKRRLARSIVSLSFAPLAVIFFGTGASVLRAAVMFFINGLAPLFRRKSEPLNTLCAAFTVLAVFSPGLILDAGFAMSVLGVFGVSVVGQRLSERLCNKLPKKLKLLETPITAAVTSACAVVCTAPISAAVFKGVSLSSALVSLLLITLMTIGAAFAVLGGIMGSAVIAVPAAFAMKLAGLVVETFGSRREFWLSLDFEGAWFLAALFAVLLTVGTFASKKTLVLSAGCLAALAVFSVSMSVHTTSARSEVRFVGNSRTGAAVAILGDSAAVLISGNGSGLAENISRCIRESGARRISVLVSENADFVGALALKELSELIEIEEIYSTPTAAAVLSDRQVTIIGEDAALSVGGVTIAAGNYSESELSADIAVYHGSFRTMPESSAKMAVYFSRFDRPLPENGFNACRGDELSVIVPRGEIKVISENRTSQTLEVGDNLTE